MTKNFYVKYLQWFLIIFCSIGDAQRTSLDSLISFPTLQRTFRKLINQKTGENIQIYEYLKRHGKLQDQYPDTVKFPCDTNNTRSPLPPNNVHELRPGDIDVIGALGDSLTAGNGIMATNLLHIPLENRGISWSIGGQDNWRRFLTIPNILKEFNPNLYGYSLKDSISTERASMFNVAELGAMSRDMPYMAKVLIKRLRYDPKVNMTHHWKLITIFIGNNDFCSDMCYYDQPESIIDMHEQDLVTTLRILRNNIPRAMVNVIPTPNLRLLTELQGKPGECHVTHRFECPCLIGTRAKPYLEYFTKIMNKWSERERDIVYRDEFNKEDFTVNYQPFTREIVFPKINDLYHDFRYLSTDCFHLSQKGQARAANALWNNMLELDNQKSKNWPVEFQIFKCPSERQPFLATRVNSRRNSNNFLIDSKEEYQ